MPDIIVPTLIAKSVLLEEDCVRILDRRLFPFREEFVVCRTYEDVAVAIEEMVTQSAGPFFAASAGLILAARLAETGASASSRLALMEAAAARLIKTRSTNNNIRDVITYLMGVAREDVTTRGFANRLETAMRDAWAERRARSRRLGEFAATLVEEGDTILTHCWAETSLIDTLAAALRLGKRIRVVCTETRPYLQGSRLTAHSVAEMGIDVTVITDNMAACAMDRGKITRLMTAADRVTLSGHVINKVGTLQLAIAARHFGLPYVAMVQRPDRLAPTPDYVAMEERDGGESLSCLGVPTASPLARGWYPAFDVTPPTLVAAVATSEGIFGPLALREQFGADERGQSVTTGN
jgi:methylthioribose-1-phosphate isomerase